MFGDFNFNLNNIGDFLQQTVNNTLNDPNIQSQIGIQNGSVKNPPASKGFLSSLPMVTVTAVIFIDL